MLSPNHQRKICLAPMMGVTNLHFRFLVRLISKNCWLYTEMIPAAAIALGDKLHLLDFGKLENPIALQLGGNNPKHMQITAKIAEKLGYDEINLNIGCPSPRTTAGGFGLCLLKTPDKVAELVDAIKSQVNIPVTIKTRIGVDELNEKFHLENFIGKVHLAGCNTFILHARSGLLSGINPKKNRKIPNINYQMVYDIKRKFPHLEIIVNGAIASINGAKQHLDKVDGIMIGREFVSNIWFLKELECSLDFASPNKDHQKASIALNYLDYACKKLNDEHSPNSPSSTISRSKLLSPLFSMFYGFMQAKKLRLFVSDAIQEKISCSQLEKKICAYLDNS
ncbi:MAG: tRNA dihydrouridine(20/20a) synthase DusA [SAR324 cluster bacterium]|nr:tRNA dihydrouridine(20/20a) synthase DusA [SAR324 cluster bacterium]